MGQCGSLVLERFSAAVAKEAIEKFLLQLLSRNLRNSRSCAEENLVCLLTLPATGWHDCVQLLPVKGGVPICVDGDLSLSG